MTTAVELVNEGVGQCYAAWRVLPAPDEWQHVVQVGLETRKLAF